MPRVVLLPQGADPAVSQRDAGGDKNREVDEKPRFRARIAVVGSEIDDTDFTRTVEESGALIVADRFCFGSLPGRQEIPLTNDESALTQVCRFYQTTSQCPRYMQRDMVQGRREYVRTLTQEYNAEGVLYEALKFCEYWGMSARSPRTSSRRNSAFRPSASTGSTPATPPGSCARGCRRS